jgi:oligoribonuclease
MSNDEKFLWIDLETTGLDPQKDSILEFGYAITNQKLEILEKESFVVSCEQSVLDNMNEWCKKTHSASGLIGDIAAFGEDLGLIEQRIINLIEYHQLNKPKIFGSSIHFDKNFIEKHMPKLNSVLHYRMVDVTGIAECFNHLYSYNPGKPTVSSHRALDDIQDSINHLKTLRRQFKLESV